MLTQPFFLIGGLDRAASAVLAVLVREKHVCGLDILTYWYSVLLPTPNYS